MLLAVGLEIWIYRSPDLKRWERSGVFHAGSNPADGVWECPELLHLPVDGGPERRWVLIVSVQYGAPAGGCGTRYFVGQFDGASFTCPDPPEQARWADFGADFYAPQAWNDAPDGRAIWVAWMSNWAYAGVTPTSSTRGVMSLPRELGLGTTPDGLALVQRPVRELAALRGEAQRYADLLLQPGEALHLGGQGDALEALIELRADTSAGGQLVLQFGADDDAAIAVRYDPLTALLSLRRGHVDWHGAFANAQSAPLAPRDGLLRLQLVLDTGSLELFADEGRLVLSNQIFPAAHQSLTLCAEGGPVRVAAVQVTSYTNALNT
jgi:sucrose-6-phosphate hydrolase SacC (GH32 family)